MGESGIKRMGMIRGRVNGWGGLMGWGGWVGVRVSQVTL